MKQQQQHKYLSHQQAEQPNYGFPHDHQSKKVHEVPVMNSKRFIMVKVTAALFKNIFGGDCRNVADAREFNFPTSFYEHLFNMESVSE